MAEDIIDILVTNYNDNVTLELDPAVTVVNISNLSGLTGIIIPSGTIGRLPYYDTASTFADSNIYTTGTIVGINNDTPTLYSTNKGMVVRNPAGNVELLLQHDGNTANSIQGLSISTVKTDAAYIFQRENLPLKIGTNDTARISILGGGRVLMGSTLPADDSTNALQVNGSGIFTTNLSVKGTNAALTINTNTDTFAQLFYHENGVLKWNAYNNYTNDAYTLGNSGGTVYSMLQSGAATYINTVTTNNSFIIDVPINTFAQLFYYENGALKWNAYNDYTNDAYTLGNGGGAQFKVKSNGVLNYVNCPTSSAGLSTGDIWSDSGVLKIV